MSPGFSLAPWRSPSLTLSLSLSLSLSLTGKAYRKNEGGREKEIERASEKLGVCREFADYARNIMA
jgi:hypothetical protein